MPYKKYARKTNRRPGYKSCGKMVISDAAKALRLAKHVKSLLNVEIKNHDVLQTNVSITRTPVILQLTNVPQGDTTNSRDGAQYKCTQLELRFQVLLDGSATRTSFRFMVICDKQTNQAIYTIGDVLENTDDIMVIFSPINLDNKRRFQIIDDFTVHVGTGEGRLKHFKKFYNLNKIIRYDGTAGDITDLTQNSLSLLMVSSETTNGIELHSFSRLRFIDN